MNNIWKGTLFVKKEVIRTQRQYAPVLQWVIQVFLLTAIVEMKEIKFEWISASAGAAVRSTKGAASRDLFSIEKETIKEFGCETINTDTGIKLPEGTYGRIAPRLILALKHQKTLEVVL